MGNKVHALGYQAFRSTLENHHIHDDNVDFRDETAFVQIQSQFDVDHSPECAFYFQKPNGHVISLCFDDVTESLQHEKYGILDYISEEQADRLFEFIAKHKKKNFIVHCHAGISRSGAVAKFICEYKGLSEKEFTKMNLYAHPNIMVLQRLRKAQEISENK